MTVETTATKGKANVAQICHSLLKALCCGSTRICLFAKYTDPLTGITERGAQVSSAGSELVGNTGGPPSEVLLAIRSRQIVTLLLLQKSCVGLVVTGVVGL